MTHKTLAAAVVVLAALIFVPAASASPARPTIVKFAEALHEAEHLEGGETNVSECRRSGVKPRVTCSVEMTGVAMSPDGVASETCFASVAATWVPITVKDAVVVGGAGLWAAHLISNVLTEGTLINP